MPGFSVPLNYRLLASPTNMTQEGLVQTICLIYQDGHSKQAETIYKVQIIECTEQNQFLPHANVTQLIFWRQAVGHHGALLQSLPTTVFNYLLREHNIIVTEKQLSVSCKRFWLDRLSESFSIDNRYVYYVELDNLDCHVAPRIGRISSVEELLGNYVQQGCGNKEVLKNRAFIISSNECI